MAWEIILKPLLKFVLSIALVVAIPAAIILIIAIAEPWLVTLPKETQEGIIIAVVLITLIGMNIITYCASYVWEKRKKWFFWVSLILSIIAAITTISVFGG